MPELIPQTQTEKADHGVLVRLVRLLARQAAKSCLNHPGRLGIPILEGHETHAASAAEAEPTERQGVP